MNGAKLTDRRLGGSGQSLDWPRGDFGGRGGALGGGKDGGQHFSGSAPAWQDFYDVSFFMDSTHSPDIITLDNHGKHIGPFPAKQKVNCLPNFFKETTFFNFPLFTLQWPSLQPSTPYILL